MKIKYKLQVNLYRIKSKKTTTTTTTIEQHVILFSYLLRLESTLVYSLYMTVPHVSTYKTLFIGQLLDEKSSNNTFKNFEV